LPGVGNELTWSGPPFPVLLVLFTNIDFRVLASIFTSEIAMDFYCVGFVNFLKKLLLAGFL
jgi:hypothetical protein